MRETACKPAAKRATTVAGVSYVTDASSEEQSILTLPVRVIPAVPEVVLICGYTREQHNRRQPPQSCAHCCPAGGRDGADLEAS